MNKGGRLEGKVVSLDSGAKTFTVLLEGRGHEQHGKEVTLPLASWNGPGAECGDGAKLGYEPFAPENPRSKPRMGDSVLVNVDGKSEKAAA